MKWDLLCCPHTHQTLTQADSITLRALNQAIAERRLKTVTGQPAEVLLHGALINAHQSLAYPVRDGIPCLLPEEALATADLLQQA